MNGLNLNGTPRERRDRAINKLALYFFSLHFLRVGEKQEQSYGVLVPMPHAAPVSAS